MDTVFVAFLALLQAAKPPGAASSDPSLDAALKALALIGAGGFFVYKVLAGYFVANLSLKLRCSRRVAVGRPQDVLAVIASLKKGPNSRVSLEDAFVSVTPFHGAPLGPFRFAAIDRLTHSGRKTNRLQLGSQVAVTAPQLTLPPGDETQYAAMCEVPTGVPCMVEATILGRRRLWRWRGYSSQWRASAVCLPVEPKSKP